MMIKKIPIRLRLTILSVLLLIICCVGLTTILNLSANRMANVIEATLVVPAIIAKPENTPLPEEIQVSGIFPATQKETSQAARNQFLQNSILGMILVVMLGGWLTYYISGKALKPLQELSSQMKNRTVQNLSDYLPVPNSHDEIADLTQSFNEMSETLEDAFAMQKRFSQSAAHELRTPLTVLKTKVDVFKKKPEHTREEYERLISVITTHTNRLADLVKNLLDLTNMDELNCSEPILLKSMLSQVSEELSEIAIENKITVTIKGEEQTAYGNPSLLHRAFYNLIENAIKYNVKGGNVNIALIANGERNVVTVSDTGIGICNDVQGLIFEPFYRVDKSRSRKMGGAGLGLATAKAIVEQHHGVITVSENPSGGCIFEITL